MICGFTPNYHTCLTLMHQFLQTETGGNRRVEELWRDYAENFQHPDARNTLMSELGMRTVPLDRIFYHLHRLSQSAPDHPRRDWTLGEADVEKSAANGAPVFPLGLTWKIRVRERIGWGGIGDVHRGARRFSGRPLAVKTLRSETPPDVLSQVAQNHRRIRDLSSLPGYPSTLCRVEDVLEIGGHIFVLMEYCEGIQFQGRFLAHDLFELLRMTNQRQASMTEEKVRDFSLQIARGAAYLLEEGLFHSDIRPENILLRRDGTAALTDFDGLVFAGSAPKHHLKVPTEFAPEQWNNQIESGENEATLIWSLGLLLFTLMAKKNGAVLLKQKLEAESGESVDELNLLIALWRKVMRGEWGKFLESQSPENDAALITLAASALAYDPANRPTLAEWISTLEDI